MAFKSPSEDQDQIGRLRGWGAKFPGASIPEHLHGDSQKRVHPSGGQSSGPLAPPVGRNTTRTDRGHLFWKVTEPAPGTLKMVKIHANPGLSLKCLASGSSQTDGRDTYSTLRVPF